MSAPAPAALRSALVQLVADWALAELLATLHRASERRGGLVEHPHRKSGLPARVAALVCGSRCTWTVHEVAAALGAPRTQVSVILARMATAGEIERVERGLYQAWPQARRRPQTIVIDELTEEGTDAPCTN